MSDVFKEFVEKLDKITLDDFGFMRAENIRIGRAGVQQYGDHWEYRPDEEVFAQNHLDSINGIPIVISHEGGLIDPREKRVTVGTVANAKKDGSYIVADLLIHSQEGIDAINNGLKGLSLGYISQDKQEGGTFDGVEYSIVQTGLRANHLALVDFGRCGAGCRLDENNGNTQTGEKTMANFKLDGVEYTVEDSAMAQAITTKVDALTIEAKLANDKSDELQGKLDEATETIKKLNDEKLDEGAVNALVKSRIELIEQAKILKADGKFDGATDKDIMVEALAVEGLEEKSDAYIKGRFDAAVDAKKLDKAGDLNAAANAGGEKLDARSEYIKEQEDARYNRNKGGK